jgi:ParB family transcriptional regulator, chromosome partitioning protein
MREELPMSGSRGMGRGLAAILSVTGEVGEDDVHLRDVPVDLVVPNPRQPRRNFDEATLAGLAESLRQRGVLQPILVRPLPGGTYELVAGERRWRAAKLASLDTVPALVRTHDDAQALEIALIENMAREDLNPVEEARACAALVEELGLTREEVGRRVGRSRVAVSNLLRLLDLPDEALALVEDGTLSEGHGRALLLTSDHAMRRSLARSAAAEGWSVRVLEDRARNADEGPRITRRRKPRGLHPDQAEAVGRIADALSGALGSEVRVKPSGDGYRAEIDLGSLDDALDFARRLRPRVVG